jgi:8-oxo-dGTP pyrophosphatase MutT (NUDIX family)
VATEINWVKAMCIVRNGSKLLVSKDYDSVKKDYYYRPLGGSVEFRERSDITVKREFMEELDVTLTNVKFLGVIENIFTMEGQNYHEIDFIYEGDIKEKEIYSKEKISAVEGKRVFETMWIEFDDFKDRKFRLVPEEIFKFIENGK